MLSTSCVLWVSPISWHKGLGSCYRKAYRKGLGRLAAVNTWNLQVLQILAYLAVDWKFTQKTTNDQSAENAELCRSVPLQMRHLYHTFSQGLASSWKRRLKGCGSKSWWNPRPNSTIWTWQDNCTRELTTSVVACTRTSWPTIHCGLLISPPLTIDMLYGRKSQISSVEWPLTHCQTPMYGPTTMLDDQDKLDHMEF